MDATRGRFSTGALFVITLAFGPAAPAAADQPIGPLGPPGAPEAAFPTVNRQVADIVSADWWEEPRRDAARESEQVYALMDIRPGMTVADIGAGSGYHTVRLSRVLGPSGRVLAEDVMPDYLGQLAARVRAEGLTNVTLGLGEFHDPRLPAGSVDRALMVHMYHEIEAPYAFLHNLVPALRPGALVGVVDLDRPTRDHGTPPAQLRCEFETMGYREVGFHPLQGDIGYLAVFAPPASITEQPVVGRIQPCPAVPG